MLLRTCALELLCPHVLGRYLLLVSSFALWFCLLHLDFPLFSVSAVPSVAKIENLLDKQLSPLYNTYPTSKLRAYELDVKPDQWTGGWTHERPHKRIHASTHLRITEPNGRSILPNLFYYCRGISTNRPIFVQNKPNFSEVKMSVSSVSAKDYEHETDSTLGENKPNSKPNKPNLAEAKNERNLSINKGL